MIVERKSPFTGIINKMEIDITEQQLNSMVFNGLKWTVPGKAIQEAFPNLSASEREFLMTGITDSEWDEAMNEFSGYREANTD